MAVFQTSLTFLTFKQDVVVDTIGTESVNLSESRTEAQYLYSNEKRDYLCQKRSNIKHVHKIRETIKELEQLFVNHRCIHLKWETQDTILLFFNSGVIASVTLDEKKLGIQKVVIDHSLYGKLVSDHVTDVILNEKCLLICYSEPKLTYINFGKNLSSFSTKLLGQKRGKILGFDPLITTVDVAGLSSRRLEKKLSLNNLKDCVLIWWRFTSGDVWPWMPVNYSVDRINMLIYGLNDSSMEILCSAKVHGELVHATFSKWHSNRILTLEEVVEIDRYHVNICSYEIVCGRCQCTSLSKLPVRGRLSAFDWNFLEDKLLLCDQEKSLLIYDLNKNTTLVTSTLFVARDIAWHPGGMIACVIGSYGALQCFDAALTMIKLQIYGEDFVSSDGLELNKLLYPQKLVQEILWQNTNVKSSVLSASDAFYEASDTLLIHVDQAALVFVNFSFGCITKNILSPLELISQYLKCGSIDESVCLLQCLNWCQQAELCYQCLSKIANSLLRKPMNMQTESALELSLGTFYNSVTSLSEAILFDYHQQIDHIARRFFHELLRYHRFEKAFLLAVDLQFRDLFLDLHHVAKQKNETMLAIVTLKHAEELEVSDSSSYDQSDVYEGSELESSCSSIYDESKETFKTKSKHTNSEQLGAHFSKQSLNVCDDSAVLDFKSNSGVLCEKYDVFQKNLSNSFHHDVENCDSTIITSKYMNRDFPLADMNSNKSRTTFFNKLNFEQGVLKTFEKMTLSSQNEYDAVSSPLLIKNNSTIKKFPSQNDNIDEEEEEDAEGKQIRFVHFGVV